MRFDILARELEAAGIGTRGTDIFIHRMDDQCKRGLLIRGSIAGIGNSPELPGYYHADFQVIVRADLQADGDALAQRVIDTLTMGTREFNDDQGNFALEIKQMWNAKLPIVYPRTDGYGIEWSINMHADYVQA